jgi:cobalt-precorrin 5A hydrolase
MELRKAMTLYAGIGLSSACTAAEIVTLLEQALQHHDVERSDLMLMASLPEKLSEPALVAAAAQFAIGLVAPPATRLQAVTQRCLTQSERVANRFGVPSVSEACALAAAPDHAILLGPRLASLRATVALVRA